MNVEPQKLFQNPFEYGAVWDYVYFSHTISVCYNDAYDVV